MYIYISEREDGRLIAHASNNLKYLQDHAEAWSIAETKRGITKNKYYIKELKGDLYRSRHLYVLLYRTSKSAEYYPVTTDPQKEVLVRIGKSKKYSNHNYVEISYSAVLLTNNCYEFDNSNESSKENIAPAEKPVTLYSLRTMADGGYQLWDYKLNKLECSCDDYSEVREFLKDNNGKLY